MDILKNTINNLKANGFAVEYFETIDEAKNKILNDIPESNDVGIGGSMTIFQMKLHEELLSRGNKVYWHWLVEPEKRDEVRKLARNTPVYLSSTNSITEDGKLINIDGVGNRVASMFYGHEKVIIVAGINKISKNYDDAIKRIKEEACPKNSERLNLDTPCRYTGKCNNCSSKSRMCNVTVTIDKNPMGGNIKLYIINDSLGY